MNVNFLAANFSYGPPTKPLSVVNADTPTCNDGVQNQNEEGVDCGGLCPTCETCFDGIENCHEGLCELGIDCGGRCMPCEYALPLTIIIISIILIIVVLILGIIYWRMKKSADYVQEGSSVYTKL